MDVFTENTAFTKHNECTYLLFFTCILCVYMNVHNLKNIFLTTSRQLEKQIEDTAN